MGFSISITDQRKLKVYEELRQGSDPRKAFFLLVAVSTLIAAFGLAMNNTAVVIGAMLVAPLMTPILGLALGLLRGSPTSSASLRAPRRLALQFRSGWVSSLDSPCHLISI
jgi:hypothetical protein